jgi:hypothetical protein
MKDESRKAIPFPAVFPENIELILTTHENLGTSHRSYLAAGMIATLATVIGGKFRLKSPVTANVASEGTIGTQYVCLVGLSSDGKSTGIDASMFALNKLDDQLADENETRVRHYNEIRQAKKDEERQKRQAETAERYPCADGYDYTTPPRLAKYLIDDFNLPAIKSILSENRKRNMALCIWKDEMSAFFDMSKRSSSEVGMIPVLNTLWDGRNWYTNRKDRNENGEFISGMENVKSPRVCFAGGIQRGIIKKFMSAENVAVGHVSRFLIVAPDDVRSTPKRIMSEGEIAQLKNIRNNWQEIINAIHRAAPKDYELTAAAAEAHQAFEVFMSEELNYFRDNGQEIRQTLIAKHKEIMPRLALLLHVAELFQGGTEAAQEADSLFNPNEINELTVQSAISMSVWFMNEALKLVDELENEQDAAPIEREAENRKAYLADLYCIYGTESPFSRKNALNDAPKWLGGKTLTQAHNLSKDAVNRLLNPQKGYFTKTEHGVYKFAVSLDEWDTLREKRLNESQLKTH